MIVVLGQVLWFFLPAMAANMAPIFAAHYNWWPQLAGPLDGGMMWRGKRLLGDHKTVRGLVIGVLFGLVTGAAQYGLLWWLGGQGMISYDSFIMSALWGAWIGWGALLGDALASAVKRRLSKEPGQLWIPWDQIDMVLGVWLVTFWAVPWTYLQLGMAVVVIGAGMYLFSLSGVILGLKKSL